MKNVHLSKLKALVVTGVLTAALLATSASATPFTYTSVSGTSTTFQQALIIDENANVPTETFSYSIAPGNAIAAASGKMEVIRPEAGTNGVVGTPTIANVTFAPGDTIATGEQATAAGVTVDPGEKLALKTATINFSGVSFSEPGIYRYIVTMTSSGQQGITYDTQLSDTTNGQAKVRVLDVYVTDNGNGTLVVSSYVFHEVVDDVAAGTDLGSGDVTNTNDPVTDKSLGFVNEYATYDLTVSGNVSGNQASHDKYFKYTVEITNAGANVDLEIDLNGTPAAPSKSVSTKYTAEAMAAANGADDDNSVTGRQWSTNASGAVTKTIYLQHGQSIIIKGLAAGAGYTVTVDGEDYKVTTPANSTLAANVANDNQVNGLGDDATVSFTLTRAGTIPTGVMLSVAPGAAILVFSVFGLLVIKRREDEEEVEEA